MIRSIGVRPIIKGEIDTISETLDNTLIRLQNNGYDIISITPLQYKLWCYPKYYDALQFIIIYDTMKKENNKND